MGDKPHLVIPYSLATNDVKFGRGVFGPGEDFFAYLRDSFDLLYEEGAEHPRMMSIGLHMRISGHPGRAAALIRFIEHVRAATASGSVAARTSPGIGWRSSRPASLAAARAGLGDDQIHRHVEGLGVDRLQ